MFYYRAWDENAENVVRVREQSRARYYVMVLFCHGVVVRSRSAEAASAGGGDGGDLLAQTRDYERILL